MPEDTLATTRESQVAPALGDLPADVANSSGSLNIGLVLLFVVVVVLIAVQNLWLRRRAEREAQSEAGAAERDAGS